MDIFKLVGSIAIKNEEANQAIDDTMLKAKDLGGALDNSGTSADNLSGKIGENSKFGTAAVFMGNMLATMATEAGKLVTNLTKAGIGLASDMEQNIGGVETLFGDAAGTVFKNADNAYKTAGMSANEYMQTITGFAAALKQSVGAEEEVARVADMAIIDMSDNANKMGTDMASIQNAYQGFAKQNFTMLDNLKLGYGGTQEEMQRLLADAGKLANQQYDISSLSDIFEAIHVIQTEMGIAGTTAQEAGTTLAGSAASAKSAWENFISNTMMTVIPKLTDVINKIMTWMEKNPETVQKISDAISSFASMSIDAVTGAFQWLIDNSEAVNAAILGIATALTIGAIAAHPYATAIMAVVAGLAALYASDTAKSKDSHLFDNFSDEELDVLRRYVDAMNELTAAETAYNEGDGVFDDALTERVTNAQKAADAATKEAKSIDGLLEKYHEWANRQDGHLEDGMYLNVPARLADDAESNMQADIDGMGLEGVVKMLADTSGLQYAVNMVGLTARVNLQPYGPTQPGRWINNLPGFATGLERVPRDNYIARLHKDEAVLTSTQAAAWRSGSAGNTGRLESMMSQLLTMTQQMVANTGRGQQVVLDSGVLVGQIAPQMDARLGTISNRKGRRN